MIDVAIEILDAVQIGLAIMAAYMLWWLVREWWRHDGGEQAMKKCFAMLGAAMRVLAMVPAMLAAGIVLLLQRRGDK